jgi:hypothetical protein
VEVILTPVITPETMLIWLLCEPVAVKYLS